MTERTNNIGMAMAARQQAAQRAEAIHRPIEALRIIDKEGLSLGDLNPLIHPTDLTREESVDRVRSTIYDKILKSKGRMPTALESTVVFEPNSGSAAFRFIARFETPTLTKKQMNLLEELVKQTYGITVRTRTDSKGNDIPLENYPPIQIGEEAKSKTGGWYMGPNLTPTTSLHAGLFVFKDMGQVNKNNFFVNQGNSLKYIVEAREADMYQTDLVTFVTQVSQILGKSRKLDEGQLIYDAYYDLMRLGLKNVSPDLVYGMEEAIGQIRRGLLLPLANPDLSKGIRVDPQSVLMVGVPGTGKTLIVEQLLNEETGLFILPIDPLELQRELTKPAEDQKLLTRIGRVARLTGRPVILHADDIEKMVEGNPNTHSTLLNLMAGVRESGFHLIAATNEPEKIDAALLQPQRFGILIYCGLQNTEARLEILKIHSAYHSARLRFPLFRSEAERDIVLRELALHTEDFTPRYLADIVTTAKTFFEERVSATAGKTVGLTEEDMKGLHISIQDWEQAFEQVRSKYDVGTVKRRDDVLKKFVQKHSAITLGFSTNVIEKGSIFTSELQARLAALNGELANPS